MPGYRITKSTLGTKADGVISSEITYYPQQGTALPDVAGVGTETAPVVDGASQTCRTKISFTNPSGASSTWLIPAPQGRWRAVDCFIRKTTGTGGAADNVIIKSVKAGSVSAGVLFTSTTANSIMDLNGVVVGQLVKAVRVLDASNVCLLDSSTSDALQIAIVKGTSNAACNIFIDWILEG
jgi:hypothetical protein